MGKMHLLDTFFEILNLFKTLLPDTLKMEQFTINKEDLTGLSGKVVVITGNLLASF
jgi:hypothetical protein